MANNDKENKIKKFTKEAIGKTLNQFNKEIRIADLVEVNKNQDRILNGILSQVNDENTEKTEKSNIITLDNSTDGIVELKEIQGDTNVNVSKIEEMPITHDIGDKEGNVFTLNEITQGAISIGEIQGNTMVNCNKDDKKELVLMKDLSTQGDNNITITEGVDGGKVDVALEGNTLVNVSKTKDNYITHEREEDTTGNHIALVDEGYIRPVLNGKTMVNVCDQKDPVAITKSYTVENSGNHVALQGDYDGKCRPVVTGKTLVNLSNVSSKDKDNNLLRIIPLQTIKANITYTVIFDLKIIKNTNLNCSIFTFKDEDGNDIYSINDGMLHLSEGKIIKSVTLSKDSNKIIAYWKRSGDDDNKIEFSNIMILEGDYTNKPIPGYFEGLQSSFEDRVVPENIDCITNRYIYNNMGYIAFKTNNLVVGKTYTLYVNNAPTRYGLYSPDGNTPLVSYTTNKLNTFTYTTSYNSVTMHINDGGTTVISQDMIDNMIIYLVEGDYTRYDFSDYDPTKVGKYRVDYKATGKNKFHGKSLLSDYTINNDGIIQHISNEDSRAWHYNNSQYFVSLPSGSYTISIYVVNPSSDINNACMIRLPDNSRVVSWGNNVFAGVSKYSIGFTLNTSTVLGIQLKLFGGATCKIQIEEGSTDTEYEPYKEGNKVLYLNSPLLEGDTIEQYGNNIAHVHRYGKAVFDGSEAWNNSDNNYAYVLLNHLGAKASGKLICDKLIPGSSLSGDIFIGTVGLGIHYNDTNRTNLATLLSWLQSNPTTVVYELASPRYEVISTNDKLLTDSYVNGHLDFESAVPVEKVDFRGTGKTLKYLQSSTSYDIQFNADANGSLDYIVLGDEATKTNIQVTKGINKINLTTISSTVPFLYFNGIGFNASNIVVTPAIEQDFGYFNGLSSTFEDGLVTQEMIDNGEEEESNLGKYKVEYKVIGKNKFNPMVLKDCPIASIDGDNVILNGTLTYHWWYKVTLPKGTYSPSGNDANITLHVFYDSGDNSFVTSKTFTYDSEVTLQGYISSGTYDNYILSNLQIEEGDTVTSYEPYKEYAKTLYLNSPLLEGDTIEEKDGSIYHVHRYKEVVLDGSSDENWSTMSNWSNYFEDTLGYARFQLSQSGLYFNLEDSPITIISDKFPSISNINWKTLSEHIENDVKKINIVTTKASTVYELKQWLQQNPVTAVYKLAEPQYELIEQSNLAIPSYANGYLDLSSAVPVSKVNFLHFEEELTYLYPATFYTVQFVSDKAITVNITLGGTQLLAQNIVKGLNRISITTPATLVNNKLIIDGIGANISDVVVTNTDRNFGYFEGMKSVGEGDGIEILSHNGNLYKRLENSYYKIYGSSVVVVEDNEDSFIFEVNDWDKGISYLISTEGLFKNKKYKLTWEKYNELAVPQLHASGITLLNSNKRVKEQISFEKISNTDWNFELPDSFEQGDILEIRFKTSIASGQNGACNICINEMEVTKNTALSKLNKQRLTHEPLRGVGDVKDRYVLIDGKWYIERNCKQVNFKDIASSVVIADTTKTNTLRFKWRYTEELNFASTTTGTGFKCDIFKYALYSSDEEGISIKEDIDVNILKSKLTSLDKTGVIQWLNNNPVNLTYIRKTPIYEPIDYNPFEVYSGTTHITTNSAVPTNIAIKNHGFNCLLKPSTTYTVSSNLGLNTVTTGADIGDSCLRFYNEDTSTKTTMRNVLILEGDWTSKPNLIPANFSGIESGFEQEYDIEKGKYRVNAKVVGKNLLGTKVEAFLGRPYGNDIYAFQQHPNADAVSYIIPCLPNTTYSLSSLGDRNVMAEFNHYPINGDIVTNVYGRTITTSNTAKWLVVYINSLWTNDDLHAQLEYGDTVTEYEPYKENNITFYLNEPLRRVGNVKDRVYIKDDKVVVQRNCGSKVFDGSNDEIIKRSGISNNKCVRYYINVPLILNVHSNSTKSYYVMSNKFANGYSTEELHIKDIEGVSSTADSMITFCINKFKLSTQDVAGFKQWLQQNPTTVVYQLAEPTYEEVEYSSNRLILNTFNNESFNNSTLFLDTNILPKLSFKPLYEELVYVKNSTKYYIQFNAVGSGEVVINLGGTELTTEIVEGYNCIPITTPSESTNLMTISGQGITISEVVVSEVVCGGYYKGLQSCFEEHMENGKYRVLLRGIALDGSKVNGIKLYINEPLRGVEGVKDRLCIKNGKLMVERKCGSITFDGSEDENWIYYKSSSSNPITTTSFRIDVDNIPMFSMNLLCDKLDTINLDNMYSGKYGVCTGKSNADRIYISIDVEKLSTQDVNVLKQYLQQNQITVVYQLAQPTYEEAINEYGLPIVFEGYENGIVYIDSAVTPTTHIKYTSNNQLATTLAEAEEQNITTQEDINMNVVTYMMDIDMLLTEMEMSNDTSVMAVRRDSSNENMLDRMSEEDKKVYRDNTVVMLEKMITANVLDKEDIEGRINMYYNKNRISKEQYEYLKSLL